MTGVPPPSEIGIDAGLVADLLAGQHPDLGALPIGRRIEGWDNVTYRLGDHIAVRLPRRSLAAPLVRNEQRWLRHLASRLNLPVPVPIRVGRPAGGYPWHWSVVPWIAGEMWLAAGPPRGHGPRLGSFLRRLHTAPDPHLAPLNPYRGGPLAERLDFMLERVQRLVSAGLVSDATGAEDALDRAVAQPVDAGPVWLHGDLHPKNVIVAARQVAGVIDWGDVCAGDPATDLSAAWTLCTAPERDGFWDAYGPVTPATERRARGWAVSFGLMLVDSHHVGDPAFAAAGRAAIDAVLAHTH